MITPRRHRRQQGRRRRRDNNGNNDGELHVYSGVTLAVTFSGTTDNGLEFGASMDAETSSSDYDPGDFEFDGPEMRLASATCGFRAVV